MTRRSAFADALELSFGLVETEPPRRELFGTWVSGEPPARSCRSDGCSKHPTPHPKCLHCQAERTDSKPSPDGAPKERFG